MENNNFISDMYFTKLAFPITLFPKKYIYLAALSAQISEQSKIFALVRIGVGMGAGTRSMMLI